jgi:hypothetical protein
MNVGYIEYDSQAVDSMRMRLRDPVNGFSDISSLNYCSKLKDACREYDSYEIVYPPTQDEAIFVTTYVEDMYRYKNDTGNWEEKDRHIYYTKEPETFYVRLRHNCH